MHVRAVSPVRRRRMFVGGLALSRLIIGLVINQIVITRFTRSHMLPKEKEGMPRPHFSAGTQVVSRNGQPLVSVRKVDCLFRVTW